MSHLSAAGPGTGSEMHAGHTHARRARRTTLQRARLPIIRLTLADQPSSSWDESVATSVAVVTRITVQFCHGVYTIFVPPCAHAPPHFASDPRRAGAGTRIGDRRWRGAHWCQQHARRPHTAARVLLTGPPGVGIDEMNNYR
jgi:hypothetical protein